MVPIFAIHILSIWIENIGSHCYPYTKYIDSKYWYNPIEFMYLTNVKEISSPIRYTDYEEQLLCKLSTT